LQAEGLFKELISFLSKEKYNYPKSVPLPGFVIEVLPLCLNPNTIEHPSENNFKVV
jgi:hypothetical protein